jgi:hypothetical protein
VPSGGLFPMITSSPVEGIRIAHSMTCLLVDHIDEEGSGEIIIPLSSMFEIVGNDPSV